MNRPPRNSCRTGVKLLMALLLCLLVVSQVSAQEDIADVSSEEHHLDQAGKLQYLLIGGKDLTEAPKEGFKLLIVLPGGDGGRGFEPFVKRIYLHALTEEYLAIQLIAPKWSRQQRIVWPTAKSSVKGARVSTEKFLAQTVEKVRKQKPIDPRHVMTLSWSSGGPAAYAASLDADTPITGSLVAMSVFNPRFLPILTEAKAQSYYILHSPDDKVCPYWMAVSARDKLRQHGATVKFVDYAGGHGWRGDVFGNIRAGRVWLEEQSRQSTEKTPRP